MSKQRDAAIIGSKADRAKLEAREAELRASGVRRGPAREQVHREAVTAQDAAWRAQDPANR